MLRNKTSSSMQKTYDDCYLTCSTAVYFEGQNNEAEALRSWRSALDQIYYHNAYRVPPNYVPKNETERALQESLRTMELQCKERVDILDALKKSRKEAEKAKKQGDKPYAASSSSTSSHLRPPIPPKSASTLSDSASSGWIGEGTIPPVTNNDLPRAPPPLPQRPTPTQTASSLFDERPHSTSQIEPMATPPTTFPSPTLPVPPKKTSRTPSPDKKGGRVMLTTLRGPKDSKGRPTKQSRLGAVRSSAPPASSKAAGLAWDSNPKTARLKAGENTLPSSDVETQSRTNSVSGSSLKVNAPNSVNGDSASLSDNFSTQSGVDTPPEFSSGHVPLGPRSYETAQRTHPKVLTTDLASGRSHNSPDKGPSQPSAPPKQKEPADAPKLTKPAVDYPSYRPEFPPSAPSIRAVAEFNARIARKDEPPKPAKLPTRQRSPPKKPKSLTANGVSRKAVANSSSPRNTAQDRDTDQLQSSESNDDYLSSERESRQKKKKAVLGQNEPIPVDPALNSESEPPPKSWDERVKWIRKHLPKGVDEGAAKQIFNEIVVRGDEVHWPDVAGLDAAKTALKEAVVYPFLRPDLFMGLREPARGMLLFGPPGTGKTMLARAVATESQSTFFAISASSLTSKWLGESEKLVRALFLLAKALAPSIIFVDEIDSLLSSRGGSSEHETTRRIKTEFLIQWSDLQRAAAGSKQSDKDKSEGDATRVLVLAATNMPWAIDEAARRRFVRRQYIPLPEANVRGEQLRTLLGHQKHNLNRKDIQVLVELTDGFSGSDITALAKDAAMGPLRSLGEALLYMSMDEIRPINFEDFEASLLNIRPSVNKQGLQEYEDWAKEFGERGV